MIKPIEFASMALRSYKEETPDLPLVFHDEAGFLMRNIQETVLEYEKFIIEKQDLIYLLSHDLKFCRTAPTIKAEILEANPSNEIKELAVNLSIF
jgi:hypothetical protein